MAFVLASGERLAPITGGEEDDEAAARDAIAALYRGRHFQFDDVAVAPKPVQQPHPPLWIGGSTPAAARRAARFGANFMPDSGAPLEVFQQYRDECAAAGRPPGEVATNLVVHVCDDPEQGWHDVKEHYFYVRQVYQQWFAEAGDLTQVDDSVPRSRRSATRRLRGRHTGDGHRRDRTTT